jgi:exonuclease SbcC
MKILTLKALNINSLQGKTEIDFQKLTQQSALFAITGPTGSGKTTLLDIISCALYGRTARLKTPSELISRHCGEAYCEVEFEVKNKRYRSSWSQKKARAKADGKLQSAKMELSDLETQKLFDLKTREVPKKVQEITGLDFEKFTQSMLLAQGGFDAFLKASKNERSALLENLTGTQIYADISMAVYQKHKELAQEIASLEKVLASIELLDEQSIDGKHQELVTLKVATEHSERLLEGVVAYKGIQEESIRNTQQLATLTMQHKACQNELDQTSQKYQSVLLAFKEQEQHYNTQTKKLKTARNIATQLEQMQHHYKTLSKQYEAKKVQLQKVNQRLSELVVKREKLNEQSSDEDLESLYATRNHLTHLQQKLQRYTQLSSQKEQL